MPQHPVLTDELLAAALGPEPRPDLQARAPRFFHSDRLERLVRAHPASPYFLYLPLIAACSWRAARTLELPVVMTTQYLKGLGPTHADDDEHGIGDSES